MGNQIQAPMRHDSKQRVQFHCFLPSTFECPLNQALASRPTPDVRPTTPSAGTCSNTPSSSSLGPSNTQQPVSMWTCSRCLYSKNRMEFYSERAPLAESGDNALNSQEMKPFSNCRSCRQARQRYNKRRNVSRRNKDDDEDITDRSGHNRHGKSDHDDDNDWSNDDAFGGFGEDGGEWRRIYGRFHST